MLLHSFFPLQRSNRFAILSSHVIRPSTSTSLASLLTSSGSPHSTHRTKGTDGMLLGSPSRPCSTYDTGFRGMYGNA